jgi:hypothetical protein
MLRPSGQDVAGGAVSELHFNVQWLSWWDWAAIAGALALIVSLAVWLERAALRHRAAMQARQRDWHRRYFKEGGLVRTLMKRWRGPAKLTDQRIEPGGQ